MADAEATKEKKKRRSTAKGKFHRTFNAFMDRSHKDEDVEVLFQMLKDLEANYKHLEEKHDEYIQCLDSGDEDGTVAIKSASDDTNELYHELCEVRGVVEKMKRSRETMKAKEEVNIHLKKSSENLIQVKKLEAPKFSGNIRDYPTFKRDYEVHMMRVYGKDPFALRSCLSGEAEHVIRGADDDYEEIFRRLDQKYGCPEKLVDSVMLDLKKIQRVPDNDNMKFVRMVDVVETCWLDLSKMNMKAEMNTTVMMSHIEKLLPALQRREWALARQRMKEKCTFEDLLKFLLNEKEALEYISDDIRKPNDGQKGRLHTIEFKEREMKDESLEGVVTNMQSQMMKMMEGFTQAVNALSKVQESQVRVPQQSTRMKCWFHESEDHDINNCSSFIDMDATSRVEAAKQRFVCFCCLKVGHISRRCFNRKACSITDRDGRVCGRFHHKMLHVESIPGTSNHGIDEFTSNNVLLTVSEVMSGSEKLTVLWDSGANISLISKQAARNLKLKGKEVLLSITKVGNVTEDVVSMEYLLPLTDENKNEWFIPVYEIEEITAVVKEVDISKVVSLFKHTSMTTGYQRPSGKVHVLIGLDWCKLMPEKIEQVGNLQLMKNPFGYSIRGSHPTIKSSEKAVVKSIHINLTHGKIGSADVHSSQARKLRELVESYMNIEGLGVQVFPRCGNCGCGQCLSGTKDCTIKEERELSMIIEGLKLDEGERKWNVRFPWVRDPNELPNNYPAAMARLQSTEKRIMRSGEQYVDLYNSQVQDMVERKVARKLSVDEIKKYDGPVHYIPHHEVLKPDSQSTPMRIVFNSSSSFMGHCLNDYWAKGPNTVTNLLAVLLKFRQYNVAVVGDIRKMYNTIGLSILDQHVHRFLWRDAEIDRLPDHYILTALTFGDKPSAAIATTALRKTAEMFREKFPIAADVIDNNTYVDDLLLSVESLEEAKEASKQTQELLDCGGFKIKHWVISKANPKWIEDLTSEVKIIDSAEEKVLGMVWNPKEDTFRYKINLNFSLKNRGVSTKPSIAKESLIDNVPTALTPRIVVSQLARIYDPLGLVIPYTIEGKLLLRRTFLITNTPTNKKYCWDELLSTDLRSDWIEFYKRLYEVEQLHFIRCLKPLRTHNEAELILFSDASEFAYGTCAYVRWRQYDDEYSTSLVMAKNRIAPKRKLSIPRLELCAAVLASRLRKHIENSMNYKFCRVIHLIDSMIVRDQIQNESYGFKTFTAVRIGEIQENTEPSEWYWISSALNPADLVTRNKDISSNKTFWTEGPGFLKQPKEMWPIHTHSNINNRDLPDRIVVNLVLESKHRPEMSIIDIQRFSKYKKLIKVTAILLSITQSKSFKIKIENIEASIYEQSEMQWIHHVQKGLGHKWEKQFQRLGPKKNAKGIITVGKRLNAWLRLSYNPSELILLPDEHRFTYLYILMIHQEDHTIDSTIAKVRNKFWIPKLTKIVKGIKRSCITCRRRDKRKLVQEMGDLPIERLLPSPPFFNCGIDLFGPFLIKDTVKGRSRSKCYGVIFNCLSSRAVYLDIVDSYDTDAFLLCLRRFFSLYGFPKKIISDQGSQLVCAAKELQEISRDWNWKQILQCGRDKGLEWQFNKSANAPWENGCSEALIRLTKRNLELSVGNQILNLSEIQTVVFEVASLLNQRPIGVKAIDGEEITHLCPNDLLLGRASPCIPPGNFDESFSPKRRFAFVQKIVDGYWKRWIRYYFSTLIIRQKWHTSQRNVKAGDIMLVQDANSIRGTWKLVELCEANAGSDNKVRDVKVRYKATSCEATYRGSTDIVISRPVHKLVLVLPVEEINAVGVYQA